MTLRRSVRAGALAAAIGLALLSAGYGATAAQAAQSHAQITGSGSTWASNAVDQWVADVTSQGLQVVFTGTGSAQGRSDFASQVTDFGVTDIGFQGIDPGSGVQDTNCSLSGAKTCRPYAYEPIVAGGTSFPYHIVVAGKLVRNLRLSGETLTKIFTYNITNWDSPDITRDNNGHALPSLPIIPVTHSEGSGSSAQFTMYMNTEYPAIWQKFAKTKSFLEYYPLPTGSEKGVAQNGSDGVMNFVSSSAANGAIGYDEYSYPQNQGYPVAAILNKAGYYTIPSEYNVAVALQHAVINTDKSSKNYLLQSLNNVYVAPEPQVYPLSSYSYFLIPTGTSPAESRMTTAKRQTLADFLFYAVCQGQAEIGHTGYSPLPSNLVQASFQQTVLLNKADPKVNVTAEKSTSLASCNNPTFVAGHLNVNHLAQIAPLPAACAKVGQGPCADNALAPGNSPGGSKSGGSGNGSGPGSGSGSGSGNGSHSGGTGGLIPGSNPSGGATGANGVPDGTGTGQPGDAGTSNQSGYPNPTNLASDESPNIKGVLGPLAVIELVLLLVVPPLVYFFVIQRRRKAP